MNCVDCKHFVKVGVDWGMCSPKVTQGILSEMTFEDVKYMADQHQFIDLWLTSTDHTTESRMCDDWEAK